jgi:DNA repair protein RecO (recombination protein O)
LETFEGLILKQINFKESSKILYLYTASGPMSLLVHGAKKMNSPFLNLTQNLTLITCFATGKGLKTLTDGEIIQGYDNLKANLEKFTCAQHLTEILQYFSEAEYDHAKMYEFTKKILARMEGEPLYLRYVYLFELKYLHLLGVAPSFFGCSACGALTNLRFSANDGGFACPTHAIGTDFIDLVTVEAMKTLFYHDLKNPLELEMNPITDKQIRRFLDDYYLFHLNFKSKSRQILAGLLGY